MLSINTQYNTIRDETVILTVLAVDKLQPGVKAFKNNWSR